MMNKIFVVALILFLGWTFTVSAEGVSKNTKEPIFVTKSMATVVQQKKKPVKKGTKKIAEVTISTETAKQPLIYKVTFVELGSVKCIPCKMMQPIMKSIEEEYKSQVKVVFYDVWTEEGRPYAEQYQIRVIPTQVFLDKEGNEYYRHEGFFPKEELIKILQQKGVK